MTRDETIEIRRVLMQDVKGYEANEQSTIH